MWSTLFPANQSVNFLNWPTQKQISSKIIKDSSSNILVKRQELFLKFCAMISHFTTFNSYIKCSQNCKDTTKISKTSSTDSSPKCYLSIMLHLVTSCTWRTDSNTD